MKESEFQYHIHNPNSEEDTILQILKVFMEVGRGKIEDAMRQDRQANIDAHSGRYT